MNDKKLAKKIGEAGRKVGVELYGRENRAKDWQQFLFSDIWKSGDKEALIQLKGNDVCSLDGSSEPKQRVSAVIGMGR
jgi:hypothetical protein